MNRESVNKLFIVGLFAIAFGVVEGAVVVYARKLLYSNGPLFPLDVLSDPSILGVEFVREIATMIMLVTIAILVGKKFYERFAYFIYAFAIWDVVYYVTLKLALDWPASFFTWDVLFLIPWTWVGPVLSPLLWCIAFIALTVLIIHFVDLGVEVNINWKEWSLMILGVLVSLSVWMYDFGKIIFGGGFARDFFGLMNNVEFTKIVSSYIPSYFNWPIFLFGLGISGVGFVIFYLRMKGVVVSEKKGIVTK